MSSANDDAPKLNDVDVVNAERRVWLRCDAHHEVRQRCNERDLHRDESTTAGYRESMAAKLFRNREVKKHDDKSKINN